MLSLKNRKAVSPVIATVILVAIAITVAVAVAFWIGGITGQYTRFEKLEISSAYRETNTTTTPDQWETTIELRNTGTIESAVIDVYVNGKRVSAFTTPVEVYNNTFAPANLIDFTASSGLNKLVVTAGQSGKLIVVIKQGEAGYTFTSGTTIEISLHSSAGNNYMKMVTLS